MNVGFISLGCVKNSVDSEMILSYLKRNDFNIVDDPNLSDIIIVNTCGFIEDAKKESINTIFEMLNYKKVTVVVGCLVERYYDELVKELPEVSLFVPIRDYDKFGSLFQKLIKEKQLSGELELLKRSYLTPSFQAYVKIADGCDNHCTYCAIPLIRGKYKSIPFEEVQESIRLVADNNVKEIILIAQDTSCYGREQGFKHTLEDILKECLKYNCFKFIRVLYLYPDEITDSFIDLYKNNARLTPYFDIPLQHISNKILKNMNRRGSKEDIIKLINKIRNSIPNAILRTTLMLGFPGETEEDFQELKDFIIETKFDRLGCFSYSPEDDTASKDFSDQVAKSLKNKRKNEIMKIQARISYALNKDKIGKEDFALVTDFDSTNFYYVARSSLYAPDDVDGKIILYSDKPLDIGDYVKIKYVAASTYDLEAKVID